MRAWRWWITGIALAIAVTGAVHTYAVWRRGDDLRIPGVGIVRRFPCAAYAVPSSHAGVQAFEILDHAAVVATSGDRAAVRTLVDAVFDREVPAVRCGNPLRQRVADAEWQFRHGTHPPITEHALADVSNDLLAQTATPAWARVTVEEVHILRTTLWPEVPHLIGSVDNQVQLSDRLSPLEAVFIVMTLGKGMLWDPDDFSGGPEAYVEHVHERQRHPQVPSSVVLSVRAGRIDLRPDLNVPDTIVARSAHRLLDRLSFPPARVR
jgi:hypothetical protein